jgi:hypothetical protein
MDKRINDQPKYKIGQEVIVEIKTKDENSGIEFRNTVKAYISVIKASGTSEKDTYEYGVTTDLPACYHSGKHPFAYIYEDKIILNSK